MNIILSIIWALIPCISVLFICAEFKLFILFVLTFSTLEKVENNWLLTLLSNTELEDTSVIK